MGKGDEVRSKHCGRPFAWKRTPWQTKQPLLMIESCIIHDGSWLSLALEVVIRERLLGSLSAASLMPESG